MIAWLRRPDRNPAFRAQHEAAEWIVMQDKRELTTDERRAFHAWLSASSANRQAFRETQRSWAAAERLKVNRREAIAALENTRAPSTARRQRALRAAGFAAAAAGFALWAVMSFGWTTYRTGVGEFSKVVLADGSTVNLNTDTEIRVRLRSDHRSIQLLHGEAAFTVAHDRSRPFDVVANGTLVRAVGTMFNVRADNGSAVEVTVAEGRVLVASEQEAPKLANRVDAGPTLGAGEVAVVRPAGIAIRRGARGDVARRLAWLDGNVELQGQPLVDAVAEFNRYSRDRLLRVGDPSIAEIQVGGRFRSTDLDSFVAALEASFGIRSRREGNGIVLLAPQDAAGVATAKSE